MKSHFIDLFNYDQYANRLILDTIVKANDPEKPLQLMAHLLAAQQIWLLRCKGEPATGSVLWPDWETNKLELLAAENYQAWMQYLENLHLDDFEKVVSYKNSKGDSFENKLSDILVHLINHGTHHRAQAGQHLKLAGAGLPNTDYIFYLRMREH